MDSKKVSGIPTLAYFAWAPNDRLVLVMRFTSVFSARKGVRAIMQRLIAHGINQKIVYSKPEPNSGEFEVELMFCPGESPEGVAKALIKPPVSNRGVTKNV